LIQAIGSTSLILEIDEFCRIADFAYTTIPFPVPRINFTTSPVQIPKTLCNFDAFYID
jgi:hypothetical protein